MRIGVSLAEPTGPRALALLADQLRRAADDGFSSVWLNQIFGFDALTAFAVAGSQVPEIELGTAVVPVYPRHPAALAQQALTVAAAVDGRLTLGIGLSHKIVIDDMYGYSFDRPARYMREYLSILLPLLDEQRVSFSGEVLRASIGLSVPYQERVPVLLAALAPQMLRLAGERTDGTVLWMTGPATVASYVAPASPPRPRPPGVRSRGWCACCPFASPTTPTAPAPARARSSRSTGNCLRTARCWTARARRGPLTWPSSAPRMSSPRSSRHSRRRASPTSSRWNSRGVTRQAAPARCLPR